MTEERAEPLDERVLVLAPTARDAATTRGILEAAGVRFYLCNTIQDVCREAGRGVAAAVVTAEAIMGDKDGCLAGWLKTQPPWSDLPLVVLTPPGVESRKLIEALEAVGHMTLMKRPVQVSTLVSIVQSALRDRRRQYAVRDFLAERQRAIESLARDALLLANVHDAVIVSDLKGVVTYWNAGATRLFGWTAAEMIGRNYADRFPEPVRAWVDKEIRSRAEGSEWSGEYEDYRKDGSRVWIDCRVTRVSDAEGRMVGILGLSHDISERKKAEDALKEADRRKDDFLALLAHELRNPLAPIRNGLQVMRLAGDDPEAIRQARAVMDRQLGHMVRLIDDLLDVARISRNKMELRRAPVLLADVVSHAVETARPVIEAAGHELAVSLPPQPIFLNADLTRLSQVFSNLLTNSAKYTNRGGRVSLSAKRHPSELAVVVQDTGIGIPSEALPSIFDMFSQVDRSIERSTGGLGIGLALVKGLVEMHGGTVEAASAGPGEGSAFTVRLPVLESRSEFLDDVSPDDGPVAFGSKRRILVVDDNHDSAHSMAMMLRLLGNEVATAHDGIEAVETAERFRPEVILMDIGMPRLNGLDATRRIRAQPWGRSSIIIALTGWGQEGDRAQSRNAGCDGHLVKPVNLPDLEKFLTTLTESGSSARE